MRRPIARVYLLTLLTALLTAGIPMAAAAPEGTMTWGVHITPASRWLDPAETEGIITPFMVLYALHDAVVKPMPAALNSPSLAESWTLSKDGLTYEFVLRKGVTFHNGDPVTAADDKFSFDRYKGAGQRQGSETDAKKRGALIHQIQGILHDRVIQIPIYELAFIWGVGPRVEEPGINLIRSFAYSAPLEDVRLKKP
ncbi:MAG TPA: ABC transporter substrate-binding protein [Methylomirabilota bacterium]|nr:ABC transporter substrate-binding protein [Methylomirabilota bacterium]